MRRRTPGLLLRGALPAALLGAAAFALASLDRAESRLEPRAVAAASSSGVFGDADNDGLLSGFEDFLANTSTLPKFAASANNVDSDGDGQSDLFEYVLSADRSIVTPGQTHAVVPAIRIATYQSKLDPQSLIVSLYVLPGTISFFDDFELVLAGKQSDGTPFVEPIIANLPTLVEKVDFHWQGDHMLAGYHLRIPKSKLRLYNNLTIGAAGRIGTHVVGDQAIITLTQGHMLRWFYTPITSGLYAGAFFGEAQPQSEEIPEGWTAQQVCGAVDTREPTGVPGVLESVVQSVGCTSGSWACSAGVCNFGTAVAQPKLVLDVHLLLDP